MTTSDVIILAGMAVSAIVAAVAFAAITRYLFDRGLADRHAAAPDILAMYKTYAAHTRKTGGGVGLPLWIHAFAAGLFVATGVGYTIVRFVLPLLG